MATPMSVASASGMGAGGSGSSSSSGAGTSSGGAAASSGSSSSNNNLPFEKDKIWYFSNDQLANSPSRRCGIKSDDELQYRQMTAYLIQEMGQRLQVSQLCINTAIVYMHRFYAFHSFTQFHRNSMASASLFLAAKVEEQPRKLEHVIRAANKCLPPSTEQNYADLAQELVFNENVLLQTLGFDVAIDHPHTHVVRTCQLVKACKDLAQTSYFLASNSLHLTSMCLQYRPTVVACFCIYLACKWSRWEIPQSTEGKHWFYYVDKSVSLDLLKQLTDEFIAIYEKSPARLKSKLNSIKAIAQGASNRTAANKDNKPKEDWKMSEMIKGYHSNITPPPELLNGNDSRERERDRDRDRERERADPSLLPPPSMVPQQRRPDGSHQRSSGVGGVPGSGSSSSSSSSSSNHKLPNYPGGMPSEAHPDYKSKQPGYSNRMPSGHQRSSSSSMGSSGSSGSGQRSSSSSSSSSQPGRPSMPVDYHKPSRGMPPVGVGIPPPHGSHKMPPGSKPPLPSHQQQPPPTHPSASSSSVSSKDKSQSSKMYPNAPPPYSSSAPPNPSMSRGGYPGSSNGSQPAPPAGYGGHRSKSGSTVHGMPPFEQQMPYSQSQSYGHMQPQQAQQSQLPTLDAPPSQAQAQSQSKMSLFSPEWSDIKKEPLAQPPPFNGLLPPPVPQGHDYKLNNHPRDKESPKKERLTPTKKEKHRPTGMPMGSSSSSTSSSSGIGSSSSSASGSAKPMMPPHKKPLPHGGDLLANTGEGGSLKRANDISGSQYGLNKLDDMDGSLPREKLRKLDNSTGLPTYPSYEEKHPPLNMSNGIETTPDLVRSLLKESLCPSNASLLKPDPLTMPGLKPPAELLEPMPMATVKKEPGLITPLSNTVPMELEIGATKLASDMKDETGSTKSEKKKKKDKHKHKEKDKSKDKTEKEERKKHKKDKQKDRSSSAGSSGPPKEGSLANEPLKLTIKNPNPNPNGGLKLKIKVESSNYSTATGMPGAAGFGAPSATATTASSAAGGVPPPQGMVPGYNAGGGAGAGGYSSSGGSSSGGSSKKKHSDRDRSDKESKKSKSQSQGQDYAKYNGVGGGGFAPLGGAGAAVSMGAPLVTAAPPALLMAPASTAAPTGGLAPPPLPVYSKK
ncbi:cyclin-T [Drosophila bipectinata]|uniref:cyclin-T n=1 Tax=Drosophila bipectinata TaxID=42026 RepID=UPI001C8A9B11|nr:cyclin-T [Drosophila bipectinata]